MTALGEEGARIVPIGVPATRPLRCCPTGRRHPDTTASTAGQQAWEFSVERKKNTAFCPPACEPYLKLARLAGILALNARLGCESWGQICQNAVRTGVGAGISAIVPQQ